jgi:hypothetical protein
MKFIKGIRSAESGETTAFLDRLSSITSRGKGEVCSYGDALAADEALKRQRQQRRFWGPEDPVAEGTGV